MLASIFRRHSLGGMLNLQDSRSQVDKDVPLSYLMGKSILQCMMSNLQRSMIHEHY